jgi:hypothetical protein
MAALLHIRDGVDDLPILPPLLKPTTAYTNGSSHLAVLALGNSVTTKLVPGIRIPKIPSSGFAKAFSFA